MLDEEELGHLGVLEGMTEGETDFALRAKYWLTARRGYVKQDCSLRSARAMLRKSAPVPSQYRAGDLVCFRRERRSADDTSTNRQTQTSQEPSHAWSSPEARQSWSYARGYLWPLPFTS